MKSWQVATIAVCFSLTPALPVVQAEEIVTEQAAPPEAAYVHARAIYKEAWSLVRVGQYDGAIRLLRQPATDFPFDLNLNALLGKALLDKCQQFKTNGNPMPVDDLRQGDVIGKRLLKMRPDDPRPYYLLAKVLLLEDRPIQAGRYIRKAISLNRNESPYYPDYYLVLGDSWRMQAPSIPRAAREAQAAYDMAIAVSKNDILFIEQVRARIAALDGVR